MKTEIKANSILQVNQTRQNGTPDSFQAIATGKAITYTTKNVKGQIIPLFTIYQVRRMDSGRIVNVSRRNFKVIG